MTSRRALIVITCFAVTALGQTLPATFPATVPDLKAEIHDAMIAGDVDALVDLEQRVQDEWAAGDPKVYAELMMQLAYAFGGLPREKDPARLAWARARRCAVTALSANLDIDSEMLMKFTVFLGRRPSSGEAATDEDWARQRLIDMDLCFQVYKRLHDRVDWTYDPVRDEPARPLPPGGGPPVSPRQIQDPQQRQEYEAAIAQFRDDARRWTGQQTARIDLQSFSDELAKRLIEAYNRPPRNDDELIKLMDQHGMSEPQKEEILGRLRESREPPPVVPQTGPSLQERMTERLRRQTEGSSTRPE